MSKVFTPQTSINRLTPQIFLTIANNNGIKINDTISESIKTDKCNLYFTYVGLDGKDRSKIESNLFEINKVATNIGSGEQINKLLQEEHISLPDDMLDKTVYDQAMWLYLNVPTAWDRISRFAYVDKISSSVWLTTNIINIADEVPFEDSEDPNTELLAERIGEHLRIRDGRGRSAKAEYYLRNGNEEYYFVFLDDYNKYKTECRDGKFEHNAISYDATEAIFVFNRDSRTLEAKFPTGLTKPEKHSFCDIWAKCIKNSCAEVVDNSKPAFSIDKFLTPDFKFTQDKDAKVVSARVLCLSVSLLGNPGSKRIYEEKQGDIYEKIKQEIDLEICRVEYVVIQFLLADEFGRSKSQQVKISRDGHNILGKNPAVQDVLRESLVRWQIANA